MTTLIAEAYKALFAILAFFAVVLVGVAVSLALADGRVLQALLAGGVGFTLIVLMFGALALQIQNNQLLRKIADGVAPAAPRPATPSMTPSDTGPWPVRKDPPPVRRDPPVR